MWVAAGVEEAEENRGRERVMLLADCTEWGVERARCREQVHGGGNNLVIT